MSEDKWKIVLVKFPRAVIEDVDKLVSLKFYPNRAEAIRLFVKDGVKRELWLWSRQVFDSSLRRVDKIE